jgi:F0F1-type ATP synthase assembly protein I
MQEPSRSSKPRALSDAQIAGLFAQSGCLVFGIVLGAVVGGILLDRLLNTRPLFTLLLVLGSAPLTLFFLYRFAMRTLAKAPPSPAAPGKISNVDDDNDS